MVKLSTLLGMSFLLCSVACGQTMSSAPKALEVKELSSFKNLENPILIDVRRPDEVSQGKIEGAREMNVLSSDFKDLIGSLDKDSTYVVYCRSGKRSARAQYIMEKEGFTKVYNLLGGYLEYEAAKND